MLPIPEALEIADPFHLFLHWCYESFSAVLVLSVVAWGIGTVLLLVKQGLAR